MCTLPCSAFRAAARRDSGYVYINSALQGDALWRTVGHEVAHGTAFDSTSQADRAVVEPYIEQRLKKASPRYRAKMEADADLRWREGVAEMVGDFLAQPKFREQLQRKNPTLFEKLRDAVLKVLGKFTPQDAAHREVLDWLRHSEVEKPGKKLGPQTTGAATTATKPTAELGASTDWAALEQDILNSFGGNGEKAAEPAPTPKPKSAKKISPRSKPSGKAATQKQFGPKSTASAADAAAANLAKLFDDLKSQGIELSETGESEEDVRAAGQAWREQKTRSPWFKRWFGDWESRKNRKPVPYSVATSTGISGRSEAIKIGYGLRGNYANLDTGIEVSLFRDGVKDTVFRHQQDFRAIRAIPALIRNARRFAVEPYEGKLPGGKWVHVFYAPLTIGDETHLARLTVVERLNHRTSLEEFRLYNLSSRENERLARNKAAFQSRDRGASQAGEPIATISIDELIEAVKEHDPQHAPSVVVNPDGTPKVVYHGTDADFTVFEPRGPSQAFWFSDDKGHASAEGSRRSGKERPQRIIDAYLDIKRPLILDELSDIGFVRDENRRIEQAKVQGYDGIIYRSDNPDVPTYYVAFASNQIKSATGNRGTFGPSGDITLSEEDVPPARPRNPQLEAAAANMTVMYVKEGVRDWDTFVGRVSSIVGPRLSTLEPYIRHTWDYVRGRLPDAKMDSSRPLTGKPGASNETTKVQPPAADGIRDQSSTEGSTDDLGEKPTQLPGESQSGSAASGDNGRSDELAGNEGATNLPGSASKGGGQRGSSRVGGSSRSSDDGGRGLAPAGNFKLTDDVQVGGERGFGKKSRYRDNLAAIKLLKQLETDWRRETTLDEQKVLAKYVGWGGIKEVFKKKVSDEWKQQQAELKSLLTPEEYAAAKKSIQNAHYTHQEVV